MPSDFIFKPFVQRRLENVFNGKPDGNKGLATKKEQQGRKAEIDNSDLDDVGVQDKSFESLTSFSEDVSDKVDSAGDSVSSGVTVSVQLWPASLPRKQPGLIVEIEIQIYSFGNDLYTNTPGTVGGPGGRD